MQVVSKTTNKRKRSSAVTAYIGGCTVLSQSSETSSNAKVPSPAETRPKKKRRTSKLAAVASCSTDSGVNSAAELRKSGKSSTAVAEDDDVWAFDSVVPTCSSGSAAKKLTINRTGPLKSVSQTNNQKPGPDASGQNRKAPQPLGGNQPPVLGNNVVLTSLHSGYVDQRHARRKASLLRSNFKK